MPTVVPVIALLPEEASVPTSFSTILSFDTSMILKLLVSPSVAFCTDDNGTAASVPLKLMETLSATLETTP